MFLRRMTLIAFIVLFVSLPCEAQNAHPYVLGEVGGSFGDGSTAPAVAVGFGYLTPRNVGFEIEVSYVPDLDFGDPGFPRIAIFPPLTVESSGRIVGLQTNVIAVLPGGGTKLRAFVLGGGGVADVEQQIRVGGSIFTPIFRPLPGSPDFPPFPDILERSTTFDSSDTSLVLGGGAGFEYAVARRLGLGMVVRYHRVFSDPQRLDMARVGARATWRF